MRSLLDAGTLSKVLRVSPERIEELARTARLPFAFSAGQGILVDHVTCRPGRRPSLARIAANELHLPPAQLLYAQSCEIGSNEETS